METLPSFPVFSQKALISCTGRMAQKDICSLKTTFILQVIIFRGSGDWSKQQSVKLCSFLHVNQSRKSQITAINSVLGFLLLLLLFGFKVFASYFEEYWLHMLLKTGLGAASLGEKQPNLLVFLVIADGGRIGGKHLQHVYFPR